MATQAASPSSAHSPASPQVVGNSFVEQYYEVLIKSPKDAHRFYEKGSVLGRPGPNGVVTSVTGIEGIEDKILSLHYEDCKVQITTIDAQASYKEGVIVLVTGLFTGKDDVKRSFTQTFFLAPQTKGFYVLNDIFRFVEVLEPSTPTAVSDANENVASTPSTPNQESAHAPFQPGQSPRSPIRVTNNGTESSDSSDQKDSNDSNGSVVKALVSEKPQSPSHKDGHTVAAKPVLKDQEDSPKMSYASIVAKESTVTSPVQTPTVIVAASSTHYLDRASAASKASALHSNSAPQNSNANTEGTSVYIGNLPYDVTIEQLDGVLKKFGPIKKDGIQLRKYEEDGFCYAFGEFVSSSSARSAIKAHYITIGSNEAYITEKKSTNQASNGRGRFPSGKGEVRNDKYRRQNFAEGRSYGRYQDGNRGGEFAGQTRGPRWSNNGEGRELVYQDGGGRTPHSSGSQ